MKKLGKFEVVSLGVHHSDYFQGFGSGNFDNSCVGIGDTESAAFDDCLEMMAQSGIIDLDEERILDEYGNPDDITVANNCEGCTLQLGWGENDVCNDCPTLFFHIGIRWNSRAEDRLRRIKAIDGLEPLRYEDYSEVKGRGWGYTRKAKGNAHYGDFKETEWPTNAEEYGKTLCDDSGEVYFYVPHATYSDNDGCTVSKANHRCVMEEWKHDWIHSVGGGWGTTAVAIGVTGLLTCDDDTFDEVCDALEGLADYPCLDDDTVTEVEMEGTDEAWELWASDDFTSALEAEHEGYTFDWPDNLRLVFEVQCEKIDERWRCEGCGPDMYVDIDAVVKSIIFDDIKQWAVRYEVSFIDVGEVIEIYYTDKEATDCVNCLRKVGISASYRVVKPDHLKIKAMQAAESLGHKMEEWVDFDDNHSRSKCKVCGKEVDIIRKPKPDIGGLAVAIGCSTLTTEMM